MLLEGHIENGVVVFDEQVTLANGTPVRVEIVPAEPDRTTNPRPSHFLEHYKNVIGKVHDLPADAALNHDFYLYGLPKK